jgi:phytoene desaturase
MSKAVIIGAGVGGLTAAIRLAQRGWQVTVVEARDQPGGLAASLEIEGFRFDAGPYILLDPLGLEWAFRQVGTDVGPLELQRIDQVYETDVDGQPLRVSSSLEETADRIERRWPGSGKLYRQFIAQMQGRYARLQPLQCAAHPRLFDLFRSGVWRDVPFLLRSLGSVLKASQLPAPLAAAIGIWTHVAGQTLARAPSPLALVPAVIHSVGAYYPRGGIGAIPEALFATAQRLGVQFRFATRVKHIRCHQAVASGVELSDGEFLPADAVISNIGLGTYLKLLDDEGQSAVPGRIQRMLRRLPLQSPGVCAYLAVKGSVPPPYLRFRIHNEPDGCRLLVTPIVLQPEAAPDGWLPARLIAPLSHQRAETGGKPEQEAFLQQVLAETWWREHFTEVRVLATRIPSQWGSAYHLFHNSMNPVMTAEFMRAGRLAHRSPWIRRLYLTGSATHPGQWVSFCAVSGVLTADRVLEDT